jgi:rod shape-determining protein MreB
VLKVFDQTIYVQITKNAFNLLHVQSDKQSHISAAQPFSTERMGVAHFQVAEATLNKGFQQIYPKSFFNISPFVVMHQLYQAEGGLCEIEVRILKELALGAGARQVYVWEGEPLSREQLLRKVYEK